MNEWVANVFVNDDKKPIVNDVIEADSSMDAMMKLEEHVGELVNLDAFDRTLEPSLNSTVLKFTSKLFSITLMIS